MTAEMPPGVWQELAEIRCLAQRVADRYAPEWVPVDEQQPRNDEKVLLCAHMTGTDWVIVGHRCGGEYTTAWYPEGFLVQPTHWLPLPAPPQYGT